jgi:hypothetical protein
MRRQQLLAAGRRYHASDAGKQAHRRRQRAYRCRRSARLCRIASSLDDRADGVNPFTMNWLPRARRRRRRVRRLPTDVQKICFHVIAKGDLKALLSSLRRVLRHPLVRRILPDLQAEVLRSPELAVAIH